MTSIRNRLLAWLGAAVAVGGLCFVLVAYFVTLHEIGEGMDESLKQVAVAVASYSETGRMPPQRDQTHWPLPDEPHDEYDVVTMAWNANGEITYRSDPHIQLPHRNRTGPSVLKTTEGDWHLFTIADANGVVVAAQRASSRRVMAVESASSLLLPLFGMIVLMGIAVVLALKHSLQPLESASAEVASRRPDALQPVELLSQPREIQPLLIAINGLMQRLEMAFAARQRFVADSAHELRSPITALRLQLQLFERASDPVDRADKLSGLKAGMARSQRLIGQLLDLSQVDSDAAMMKLEPVDLAALARSVVSALSATALDREIDLGVVAPEPAWIEGDRSQLDLLLTNLVENALRYTPKSGVVDVQVRAAGTLVLLEVIDNGPGIPVEEHSRVFDRFFRGRGRGALRADDPTGSGLGLAIVKAVADRHNADISFQLPPSREGLQVRVCFRHADGAGAPVASQPL